MDLMAQGFRSRFLLCLTTVFAGACDMSCRSDIDVIKISSVNVAPRGPSAWDVTLQAGARSRNTESLSALSRRDYKAMRTLLQTARLELQENASGERRNLPSAYWGVTLTFASNNVLHVSAVSAHTDDFYPMVQDLSSLRSLLAAVSAGLPKKYRIVDDEYGSTSAVIIEEVVEESGATRSLETTRCAVAQLRMSPFVNAVPVTITWRLANGEVVRYQCREARGSNHVGREVDVNGRLVVTDVLPEIESWDSLVAHGKRAVTEMSALATSADASSRAAITMIVRRGNIEEYSMVEGDAHAIRDWVGRSDAMKQLLDRVLSFKMGDRR